MITYPVYRILTSGLFYALRPWMILISRFTRESLGVTRERFGQYSPRLTRSEKAGPGIWFHAASVGEVSAAVSIVKTIAEALPRHRIIVSTMSAHGQQVAREKLGDIAACVYAPLDFVPAVRKALEFFRPEILVCLETEIWPNWLVEAQRSGVRTVMVNGRISSRSIRSYRRIKPLLRPVLEQMTAFSMIRTEDAQRICELGAPRNRVVVNGNAKYDRLAQLVSPDVRADCLNLLNLNDTQPVFVAGSTRSGEEETVLDAYRHVRARYPETVLIIAPRHITRIPRVRQLVVAQGFDCQLRSEIDAGERQRTAQIVVVDSIGELQALYGVATVVFCGGSLVPLGGHNILEAAVWGKPVLYGPHMDDFQDDRALLESAGGGMTVGNAQELGGAVAGLLARPDKAAAMGAAGRGTVLENQGASRRHAGIIQQASTAVR